jgi:hypothetical protein
MTSKSRMLRLAATLSCSIALAAGAGAALPANASNANASNANASKGSAAFLGVWNYQTPDPATGLNIAVVGGHGFTEDFPQIGWVDFTRGRNGQVTGRTDQGCTWQFAVKGGELQLAYPGQQCFNKVIGSRYQMNRWTVSVNGNREREYIQATSFLPSGSYTFTLAHGGRTRATQDATADYAGHWTFSPANPRTGVNMETVVSSAGKAAERPVSGEVSITRSGKVIHARTANGCVWKLDVDGNTAELAGKQTCRLAGGSTQTYSFWSMAVGGGHVYAAMSGSTNAGEFSLATGLLTRNF